MQIKIKNTKLFLAAIFVLCTGSQLFSYGGNTAIAPLLTAIGGYEFYSLVAPLGATGMMVALPAVAALGRKIGSKTVLFLGAFLMLFGRVGMQFANSVFTIGLFNFLGSFGSGFVITAPFVMIGTAFERSASIKYYGYIATFNAIGSLIGPPLAGMLVDVNLPRISFLLWIPLYVFSLIAIGMLYPNSKSQSKEKFDVTGWLYLAIMVFAFVMWTGLSGKVFPWLSFGLLLPVAVAVFAWLLVRHSGRIANPTVPIRVFQYKRFRTAFFSNCCVVVFSTCASGYLLNYLLYVMNTSATLGSTTTIPSTIVITILGLFLGKILAKNFAKNVRTMTIIGSFCTFGALLCFALLQSTSSILQVSIGSALGGVGNAISQTCLTPYFQYGLPTEEYGPAQGMYQFSSTCMATIFVAVVGVLVGVTGDLKYVFYTGLIVTFINVLICLTSIRIRPDEVIETTGA